MGKLCTFNPLIATLKPQTNGPSYSNPVIGTLAVDGYIRHSKEGTGRGRSPPRPFLAVPNVTAHPLTASVHCTNFVLFDVAL